MRTTCLLAMFGIALGCGHDVEYTGLGEASLSPPTSPDAGPVGGPPPGAEAAEELGVLDASDLAGRMYRFAALELTAPITGALADPLNGYFAEEIDAGNLRILMRVSRHAGAELVFDVGPEGETSSLVCTLTGATFETVASAQLDFPNELLDPPSLPITNLELSGRFDPAGEAISSGVLVGALTTEDARAISLLGADFETFLAGLEVQPDLDLDGDGAFDAYRFVGVYEAVLDEGAAP